MHANVLGAMQALPQVAPWVAEADGTFAFVSSRTGQPCADRQRPGCFYKVSKAALNMVVRTAPADFPNVTWLALSPGWVQTDMGGDAAPLTVRDSVTQMRATLEATHGGQHRRCSARPVLNYDGTSLPWSGKPERTPCC